MRTLILGLALSALSAPAATVYSNPATGQPETIFFSTGPYVEIGDQIRLTGAAMANQATIQLYNPGLSGTFDAFLRFYEVGVPVGGSLGPGYSLTGQTAPAAADFTLTFSTFGLLVPKDLIFTVEIQNAAGLDLGIDLYTPPMTGSSEESFLIVRTNSFSQQSGFTAANLFFELEADEVGGAPVPEPGTFALAAAAVLLITLRRRS